MAFAQVNGTRLYYELGGAGEIPLVLVHGSWISHRNWDLVAPALSESFQVLSYDRRGHSASERPAGQGSVHEDVDDLAALIGHLELGPAWVAGNSFGATISCRLAARRPELLRGLVAHEPPLFSLLANDPTQAPLLEQAESKVGAVAERIASGDHAGAAEQFVETVALGPGAWKELPPEFRQIFIENAPTFLDEAKDPDQLEFEAGWLDEFGGPALLTMGETSPPMFAPVVSKLARALPAAEVVTFPDAGHIPHFTHPEAYVNVTREFIQKHTT
jgi:pimeloyl-ACP methyl ester carboxylesterase